MTDVSKTHTARILASIRQMKDMELTLPEIAALYERHRDRDAVASQIIAAAAKLVLAE